MSARFFWLWLVIATAMSVTGNVAHAVLRAESGTVALAAGAALVPAAGAAGCHPFDRRAGDAPAPVGSLTGVCC